MKKIYRDKILNVPKTDVFDNTFVFEYFENTTPKKEVKVVYLKDFLEKKKNLEILQKTKEKPAMWSEVYSPKDELEIFTELFKQALENKQKIHIVWVTLGEEIQMLETYYEELWFMREDINAFGVDFSIPLVTVSCHIENLMWRGSDYKAQRENIFFCPPVRESGQNKALFKGITRWVIAGIDFSHKFPLNEGDTCGAGGGVLPKEYIKFIGDCIREEKIMPLHMGKILKYNLEDIGLSSDSKDLQIKY